MTRDEFLEKLIELYEDFTEKNTKQRIEAYKIVLDKNINYDELLKYTLENHDSFKYAPTTAFLAQSIKIINERKNDGWTLV